MISRGCSSAIGSYVGLRGDDRYPTLIRKYEPKPLRVFLQDGENDLNIYVQVLDPTGRVNVILPVPNDSATDVAFGGKDFNQLLISSKSKVYRRRLNVRGANGFEKPTKPTKPKL